MKNYIKIFIALIGISFAVSCDEETDFTPPNYVAFESDRVFGVEINGSSSDEINVYASQVSGSDRSYEIVVREESTLDPAAYSIPGSVTIPANSNSGSFTLTVDDMNIGANGETLVIGFMNEEGVFLGEDLTLTVTQVCPYPPVVMQIAFDGYGSEITWEVRDSNDAVVYSGGPYADGDETATRELCLPPGSYTYVVFDSYGDGLSFPNAGSITLTADGQDLGTIVGDFGSEASIAFSL